MVENIKIFVLGHGRVNQFNNIPDFNFLIKKDLNTLDIDKKFQNDQLGEHRIFLSDEPEKTETEYLGFLTWRFRKKYPKLISFLNISKLNFSKSTVYCAQRAYDWFSYSCKIVPKMEKYLVELCEYTNLPIKENGFWANNFICHKEVYLKWQQFFRENFYYFHKKYGYNYNFNVFGTTSRDAGYFYERFAILYFSNLPDITIKEIPKSRWRRRRQKRVW